MQIEISYPKIKRRSLFLRRLRSICGLVFLTATLACPAVNLLTGGPAWSVIVLWSLYTVWTLLLKQPLVERNLLSQGVRLLAELSVLLLLIDRLLCPGWALFVVPLVVTAALIALCVLFFADVNKRRHNVMPLISALSLSLLGSLLALFVFDLRGWPMIVLASVSASLLAASAVILGGRLPAELRRRFHIR